MRGGLRMYVGGVVGGADALGPLSFTLVVSFKHATATGRGEEYFMLQLMTDNRVVHLTGNTSNYINKNRK